MFELGITNIQWLALLGSSILASTFTVLVPNLLKQTKNPRAHNSLKLLNDCLARHQFVYVIYFVTLLTVANLHTELAELKTALLTCLILLALVFYFLSVYSSTHQDDIINRHHACKDPDCSTPIPFMDGSAVYRVNLVFAIVLLALGIGFALVVRKPAANDQGHHSQPDAKSNVRSGDEPAPP